jgi:hypothetical protein
MEDMLKEMVKASPALAAIIIIVVLFLRALDKRDTFIQNLNTQNDAARERMAKVLEENIRVTAEQTEVMRGLKLV